MMNFFNEYPWVKWILIGFGVLHILDKYLGFSPIDKLINRVGKYKFKMISHLNDKKLKQLIEDFNQKRFDVVAYNLDKMKSNYRSFAFKCLGQYGDIKVSEEWIKQENSVLPKVIKGYQLIDKAWEIRGRESIDKVSESNLKAFKNHLKQAEELFLEINQKSNEFESNIASSLLKIYKAVDVNRETIHQIFEDAEQKNVNDAELNFNYFTVISAKWGGSENERNNYLNRLNTKSFFVKNLILAQYYFDLVHMQGNQDNEGTIKNFINDLKYVKIEDDELHKYELFLLLYWLSNNLGLDELENHYKKLVAPYWKD